MTPTSRSLALLALLGACATDGDAPKKPDAATAEDGDTPVNDAATEDDADAGEPPPADDPICTSCGACMELVPVAATSAHVAGGIDYDDPPPTSGQHDPCWKTVGVYDEEVEDERWVHNLEHGDVVLLHHCEDGCPDELADVAAFADEHSRVLVSPYAALTTRFAVVAWGARLLSDCFDSDAFSAFYGARVDRAPESITAGPPLSVCTP